MRENNRYDFRQFEICVWNIGKRGAINNNSAKGYRIPICKLNGAFKNVVEYVLVQKIKPIT